MEKIGIKKASIIAVLLVVMMLSFTVLAPWVSSARAHEKQIRDIDDNINNVLWLTAATAGASAAITLLPGDTATPVAEEISDFTDYFMLALCVLYSEKYLLTILGAFVFRCVIPAACVLGIISVLCGERSGLRRIAVKMALLGLAVYLAIPSGLKVSEMIHETYAASIESTITVSHNLTDEINTMSENGELDSGGMLGNISGRVKELMNRATEIVKGLIETIAIIVVTSCIIPLLTFFFIAWVIRLITNASIVPERNRLPGRAAKQIPPM